MHCCIMYTSYKYTLVFCQIVLPFLTETRVCCRGLFKPVLFGGQQFSYMPGNTHNRRTPRCSVATKDDHVSPRGVVLQFTRLPCAIRRLRAEKVEAILPLLKRGVGIHHGGLLPILKEVIEILFQVGHFSCVVLLYALSPPLRHRAFTIFNLVSLCVSI